MGARAYASLTLPMRIDWTNPHTVDVRVPGLNELAALMNRFRDRAMQAGTFQQEMTIARVSGT